jgi:hypothetical protein
MKQAFWISRRRFLEECGSAALLLLMDRSVKGQTSSIVSARMQFKLVKEITGAFYGGVSPDSRRICVCFTKKPIGSIVVRGSKSQRSVSRDPSGPVVLSVMELGSWKEIYSAPLSGDAFGSDFSFFSDGERLYGVSEPAPLTRESMVIDLRSGEIEKRQDKYDAKSSVFAQAFKDRILIGYRGDRLAQMEWPSLREIAGISTEPDHSFLRFTTDRTRLIHTVGQSLVCRRVEDFGVLWTRQIDADIDLSSRSASEVANASASYVIAGDGGAVALAPRRAAYQGKSELFYIEILNGIDGKPIARWPRNGSDGVALSPNGKFLAIGKMEEKERSYTDTPVTGRIKTEDVHLEPTMHIHEVPSGREIATIIHERVSVNQRLGGGLKGSGSGFTPNGKYLVTSNNFNTRIWQVDRN